MYHHYLVDVEGVNIPSHSFAKTKQHNAAGFFKLSIPFYSMNDLINISINKGLEEILIQLVVPSIRHCNGT